MTASDPNWADLEGAHEAVWADHDDTRPDLADVVDTVPDRRTGQSCGADWGRRHETAAEAADCLVCEPGWDVPPW